MPVEITSFNKTDIDSVIELTKNTPELDTGSAAPQFYGAKSLSTWLSNPNAVAFVAKDGDELVAFLIGQVMLGRDGYINMTVIKDSHRGQGLAERLTKMAEQAFASKGCNRVWSVVESDNKPMQNLKKKLGYSWGKQNFKLIDKMIGPKPE